MVQGTGIFTLSEDQFQYHREDRGHDEYDDPPSEEICGNCILRPQSSKSGTCIY